MVRVTLPLLVQVALVMAGVMVWLKLLPDNAKNTALGKGALVPAVVILLMVIL